MKKKSCLITNMISIKKNDGLQTPIRVKYTSLHDVSFHRLYKEQGCNVSKNRSMFYPVLLLHMKK